jgi:hypothetical protein
MKEWFGKNYFPVLLFGFRSLPVAAPLRDRRSWAGGPAEAMAGAPFEALTLLRARLL